MRGSPLTAGPPKVVVVAGPNGAGKSTTAPHLLRDGLEVKEFVNADAIAAGLSAFAPESVAIPAGRMMLHRITALAADRKDFAIETTLAGRRLRGFLRELQENGYAVHVLFLGLESEDLAVARVEHRVYLGGHGVPADSVRRRYRRGLRNFFHGYIQLADSWQYLDNSGSKPILVAAGSADGRLVVYEPDRWDRLRETYGG